MNNLKKITATIIVVILFFLSYFFFFILVDKYRQEIKHFLLDNKLWNGNVYVYFQNLLTNKNIELKRKDNEFNKNISVKFNLNHFTETHEVYDLEKINKNINNKINYGYITSVSKINNSFKIITSNGYLFDIDKNFNLLNFYQLDKAFVEFYTDFGYGGIRGAVWKDENNLIIYTTLKKENTYYIGVVTIFIDRNKKILIDRINYLEKLPIQDGSTSNLGGGMQIDDNNIYLSIGTTAVPDDIERDILAQVEQNFFGKIIKISYKFKNGHVELGDTSIVSKGHRNPQGLKFFGSKLISVEHGPRGGDEINLIKLDGEKILNYGWPKFSYGLTYDDINPYNKDRNKFIDSDLSKMKFIYNNKDSTYIEPIYYFTPSIALSDVDKCPFEYSKFDQYKNCFVVSSLKDESFYIIKILNKEKNQDIIVQSVERVFTGFRIRKIYSEINTIYLFLDNLKIIKIFYND